MQVSESEMVLARFIKKTLREEGGKFLERQTAQINNKLKKRTGRLLIYRKIDVYGSNGDFDAMMCFTHPIYERFLDMRWLGNASRGHKRQIHNHLIYSTYGRIAGRLMNDYTEDVQQALKKEIAEIRQRFMSVGG